MGTYSFTIDGKTVTVNTNDRIRGQIQENEGIEKTILKIVGGGIETHTFGRSCSGNAGNATDYVHVIGTKNRDLLAYSTIDTTNAPDYTIYIDATGYSKGGKHKFNVKGDF